MNDKVFNVTIYLKSGQSFTTQMKSFAISRNVIGEFSQFEWDVTDNQEHTHLKYIRVDDISAITVWESSK